MEEIKRHYRLQLVMATAPALALPGQSGKALPVGFEVMWSVDGPWRDEEVDTVRGILQGIVGSTSKFAQTAEELLLKVKQCFPGREVRVGVGSYVVSCGPGPLTPIPKAFESE